MYERLNPKETDAVDTHVPSSEDATSPSVRDVASPLYSLKAASQMEKERTPIIYSMFISEKESRVDHADRIYIEANSLRDVVSICSAVSHLILGHRTVFVPPDERISLLVFSDNTDVVPGGWARINCGRYSGDLAYVEQVQEKAVVWTVPRISYSKNQKLPSPTRLPARPFEPTVAVSVFGPGSVQEKIHEGSGQDIRKDFLFQNKLYRDGLVRMRYGTRSLIPLPAAPQLEEILPFSELTWISTSAVKHVLQWACSASLAIDDHICVTGGELAGLEGTICSIKDGFAIIAFGSDLSETATVLLEELKRLYRVGDMIQVIHGMHRDAIGFVVSVDDERITVLKHATTSEVSS